MTLQQIKLVVEAAGKNSISVAASELGIAQSNASQTIKKLEEELGFQIFKRDVTGITLTERGYLFLTQAENMLRAEKAIVSLSSEKDTTRLRVGVINYTPATDAFIRFCSELKEESSADLLCVYSNPADGAKKIKERSLDIVVTVLPEDALGSVDKLCKEYRLYCMYIQKIPVCVRLRKDHPLVLQNAIDGSRESLMKLKAYPYVEYSSLDNVLASPRAFTAPPCGCSYIISVDERQTRLETVAATNAFSLGCPSLPDLPERYGLVEIPVKGEELQLVAIMRKGDEELSNIKHYLELLKNEVSKRA